MLLYKKENRKTWVDFGKGLSMLLVVLFHCEQYLPIVDTRTSNIFSFFRMPFFFFLSGYVFTSDYCHFSIRRKLKQILRGIVWTYLVFTTIICVPKSLSNGSSLGEGFLDILLGWASWFVVSLGLAQVLFAIMLWRTKKLSILFLFAIACMFGGLAIRFVYDGILPYHVEKALFVELFLVLGFLYRIYESHFEKFINIGSFLLLLVIYGGLMYMEKNILQFSTSNVFWGNGIRNFPCFLLYTLSGIGMMLFFVKLVNFRFITFVCFIGSNSLIYYYLNGGVIKIWRFIYEKIRISDYLNNWVSFLLVFMIVVITLAVIVVMIDRFCPVLKGSKNSFNRWLPRWKW